MSSTEPSGTFDEVTGNIFEQTTQSGDSGMLGVTREFANNYSFVIHVYINSAVCFLGLFSNTLGVYVVTKDYKYNRTSIYQYMIVLMLVDNLYLFVEISRILESIARVFDFYLHNYISNNAPMVVAFIDMTAFHLSSIVLVLMALERLNALVRPFTVKQSWFARYPRQIILVVFVIVVIYFLPYPFCFEVLRYTNQENRTVYLLQTKTDLVNFYGKYSFAETIVTCVYPVVLLIINIAVPVILRRVVQKRKSELRTSLHETRQLKIAVIVLWIAFLYTLFSIPKIISQCLTYLDYDYQFDGKYAATFNFLLATGDLFQVLNSANDFFIYILISKRDRRLLRQMFCRKCNQRTGSTTYLSQQNAGLTVGNSYSSG